jgi:small subunit ribosomal protein S16
LGKKKQPFYRIVAIHSTLSRQGRALDQIGTYNPQHATVNINEESAIQWLNRGAVMTETVEALFRSQGVLARWKGFEGVERENALTKDKPKRRRKIAGVTTESVADQNNEDETSEESEIQSSDDNQPEEKTEE